MSRDESPRNLLITCPATSARSSGSKQLHGAHQLGEHAAAVDVADQQDRRPGVQGHPHVDYVVLLQVDLGRAPGALDHHNVVVPAQAAQGSRDRLPDCWLQVVVLTGRGGGLRTAHDDDL